MAREASTYQGPGPQNQVERNGTALARAVVRIQVARKWSVSGRSPRSVRAPGLAARGRTGPRRTGPRTDPVLKKMSPEPLMHTGRRLGWYLEYQTPPSPRRLTSRLESVKDALDGPSWSHGPRETARRPQQVGRRHHHPLHDDLLEPSSRPSCHPQPPSGNDRRSWWSCVLSV